MSRRARLGFVGRGVLVAVVAAALACASSDGSSDVPPVPDGYGFAPLPGGTETCYQGSKPEDAQTAVSEIADYYRSEARAYGWGKPFGEEGDRIGAVVDSSFHVCGRSRRYLVQHASYVWTARWGMFDELWVAVWVMDDDGRLYVWVHKWSEVWLP